MVLQYFSQIANYLKLFNVTLSIYKNVYNIRADRNGQILLLECNQESWACGQNRTKNLPFPYIYTTHTYIHTHINV